MLWPVTKFLKMTLFPGRKFLIIYFLASTILFLNHNTKILYFWSNTIIFNISIGQKNNTTFDRNQAENIRSASSSPVIVHLTHGTIMSYFYFQMIISKPMITTERYISKLHRKERRQQGRGTTCFLVKSIWSGEEER